MHTVAKASVRKNTAADLHGTPAFTGICEDWRMVLEATYGPADDTWCVSDRADVMEEMATYKEVRALPRRGVPPTPNSYSAS